MSYCRYFFFSETNQILICCSRLERSGSSSDKLTILFSHFFSLLSSALCVEMIAKDFNESRRLKVCHIENDTIDSLLTTQVDNVLNSSRKWSVVHDTCSPQCFKFQENRVLRARLFRHYSRFISYRNFLKTIQQLKFIGVRKACQ